MREKQRLRTDIFRVYELIGSHRTRYFTYVIITAVCGSAMNIGFANSVKLLINVFIYGETDLLLRIVLFMGASVLTGCVLRPAFIYMQNKEVENIIRDLRLKCFSVLQDLPVSYFEKRHSSDTFTAINRAIDTSRDSITFIASLVENMVSILLIIPYILSLDIRFGFTAILIGVLSSVFNAKVRHPLREKGRGIWKNYKTVMEGTMENLTGFVIIRMFGLQEYMRKKFNNAMEQLFKIQRGYTRISSITFGMNAFLGWFNSSFLSALGCWFVLSGTLDASALVASVMVSSSFTWGIISLGENLVQLQNVFEGIDILYRLFSEEKEKLLYNTEGSGSSGGVSLRGIKFGYEPNRLIINNLEVEAAEGRRIALVGNSGGGKSTIIKLILGMYEIWSGEISILGKALKEYTLEELRDTIAYVSQDALIFNDTIKANILTGKPSATDDEVYMAASKANAHEFIIQQKDGYNTVIGERGVKLSGGQRQRIAIARAILKNAPVLLLDEATSSLDNESEIQIQNALDTFMERKTCIIVAHRLSTIEKADMIYYIDGGTVVEQGTHNELLNKKGRYSELYYREFQ